jgi:hypothetical protein
MPYIKQKDRDFIEKEINALVCKIIESDVRNNKGKLNPGNLNYVISKILSEIVKNNGCYVVNYELLNNIIGCLECIKTEFNRKVVGPYEDKKICENGDLYNA